LCSVISQGKVVALDRWGGKWNHLSMTHRLTTNYTKKYCNRTLTVKVIVENVVTCFLGDTVYMLVSAHYCVPPHCTDFTDMDLTACLFCFWEHYHYFILLLVLLYYLLPCHGEIKLINFCLLTISVTFPCTRKYLSIADVCKCFRMWTELAPG